MKILPASFSALLPFLMVACSSTSTTVTAPPVATSEIKSVDIYLSRATISQAQFEQFKVANDRIFAECGKIAGGRQVAQYQDLKKLSPEDSELIKSLAKEVINFGREHELVLDEPGKSDIFYDPGQFILKMETSSGEKNVVKTSLDSVATSSKTSEENLRKLAAKLRDIAKTATRGGTLCGNAKFFDLG